MSSSQYCPGDHTFGPAVVGCRGDFDFTVKFENIVLSLLPSSTFICFALFRLWHLGRSVSVVKGQWGLLGLKIILGIVYLGTTLSTLVVGVNLKIDTPLSAPNFALKFISSALILLLSALEHFRSARPSFLLNIYLLISTLFDITQVRTQWLISQETGTSVLFAVLFTTAVAAKALLLAVESKKKSTLKDHSIEERSGLFDLVAYTWLNGLFRKGYSTVLSLKDLARLDNNIATERLHENLSFQLASGKLSLVESMIRTTWKPLILPILPRIGLVGFRFCQPFLIHSLLDHMENHQEGDRGWENAGYGFVGASVIIYFGVAVSTALYWYCQERFQSIVRGALVSTIYQTLTSLKITDVGDSAAVTLMSSDIERIRVGLHNLHEFWAVPIEVALASWLLYTQLGVAFLAPLAVVICSIALSALLNRYTGPRQKRWMECIQIRVAETVHMLANMKQLKISALAYPVEESTQQLRVDEMKAASKFRRLYVSNMAFGFAPMALCPLITFAVAARDLDAGTIFTSLAYMVLLADPLGILFGEIPYLLAALTSMGRIQDFLSKETREDRRTFYLEPSASSSESEADPKASLAPGIVIDKATIGWSADHPVFQDLCLTIPSSSLTLLVGSVGSGKSTLCKAFLAEVPFVSGGIKVTTSVDDFRVAFCDQTPHIYNTTIRQNITGSGHSFDEARYQDVLESTVLMQDLKGMQDGDETIVGSSGMTLSGGQKQRISMARALYHNANFYIFDDSLSGLDADSEVEVFTRVFGPRGMIARRRATMLLVTHNTRLLSFAQHIIALGTGGCLAYEGAYDEFARSGLHQDTALSLRSTEAKESFVQDVEVSQISQPEAAEVSLNAKDANQTTSFLSDKDRMTGDSTVYRYYLASLGKLSFLAFGLCGVGWGFFYNFGYIWLRFWSGDTAGDQSRAFYIGLYALWQSGGLISIVLCFWTAYTMMARVSGLNLHRAALQSVIRAPLWFSTTTDIGVITNLFSQDMTLVDNELPQAITNLALDVCNALGLAAVIATSSPYLAISYPVLMVVLYIVQKVYLRTSRQIRLLDLEAKSPLYTHFVDTTKGLATLRAFGWVNKSINEAFTLLDDSQKPTYLLAMVQRWLLFVLQCKVACIAIMVVTLATQTRSNSSGFTGASLVALMTFGEILNYIIRWWAQLETSIGAVTRLKALNDKIPTESSRDETHPVPAEWPAHGKIEITNVSASYQQLLGIDTTSSSGHSSEKLSHLVLENVSISIAPGEKVAVCGRSGSGKSSLVLLLLRMLDPLPSCDKNITIDGVGLHSVDRVDVRDRIIAMSQDSVFLPGHITLRRQLDPFQLATSEDCLAVLKLVELPHLASGPADLETDLHPESLSGGQRQLFNLARTVLRGRIRTKNRSGGEKAGGLLLLDEVSASMDRHTEEIMQRVIMDEFEKYTIITVSHRLEMIMDYDTVLVMESGRLVERGDPRTLARDDKSYFGQLWSAGGN